MEKYSFFDAQKTSSGYDRTYSSSDLAEYFASFVGNGVYANPANQLKVIAGKGLDIYVQTGKAFINGYYYSLSEEAKKLTIVRGDNNYPRKDLVVCSLNHSTRLIEVKVLQGTPAASPVPQTITRDDTRYDLVLAEISVDAGCTSITDSEITDKRPDNDVCGFVTGLVEQIETTGLFRQYDSAFSSWFDKAKGQLSGDVAGNLSNSVTSLQDSLAQEIKDRESGDKSAKTQIAGNSASILLLQQNGESYSNSITKLQNRIVMGTSAAPSTGTPNTIYLQLL
mgnify:CR=1 FL=1